LFVVRIQVTSSRHDNGAMKINVCCLFVFVCVFEIRPRSSRGLVVWYLEVRSQNKGRGWDLNDNRQKREREREYPLAANEMIPVLKKKVNFLLNGTG